MGTEMVHYLFCWLAMCPSNSLQKVLLSDMLCVSPLLSPLSCSLLKAQKDLCVCETFQVEEWKSLHCAYPCLEPEINSDGLRAELFSILRYLLISEL